MKKLLDFYQIDAFTDSPFQGNPAVVIYSDELSAQEMQLIAREMNVSETAFLSESQTADFDLRWFTPTIEVNLCGHATVASMHFLVENQMVKKNREVTFSTKSGILTCNKQNDLYQLTLPVPKIEEFSGNKSEILEALSIDEKLINKKLPMLLSDESYLYIYVKTLKLLKQLTPDFLSLRKLTEQKKEFEAVTVFTTEAIEDGNTAHLRFFAPYFGINEDPVTGSANGPLILILRQLDLIEKDTGGKIYIFEQGDFIGRKGRIFVSYLPSKNKLKIAGKAITVFKGELSY